MRGTPKLANLNVVNKGARPSAAFALGWQTAQLPLAGLLNQAKPRVSLAVSATFPLRNWSYFEFNDLPKDLRNNVDRSHVPFNRSAGTLPALSNSEIADVVEFLGTLTDGYKAH